MAAILMIAAALEGCSTLFPCESCTRANEPAPADQSAQCTRATISGLTPEQLPNGVFIGIAMSGGGSRAANFSSAVLLQLDALGILPRAAAISSVSGSSLTNAYYARWGGSPDRSKYWTEQELRRRLGENIQARWVARWFYPQNIAKYWTTDFDRSDIMKEIFDEVLFDGTSARFAETGSRQCGAEMLAAPGQPVATPVVLVNATTLEGSNFVFTDEAFRRDLRSRLDTYPLSHAIMASASFPGAFQNVTLQNYKSVNRYEHLFDGGPSDNLGVEALEKTLRELNRKSLTGRPPLAGCMLVLVDAFTDDDSRTYEKQSGRSDTRRTFDFIVSDNFSDAFDAMLAHRRHDTLKSLNLNTELQGEIGKTALWSHQPFRQTGGPNAGLTCHIWHLTFQRLRHLRDIVPEAAPVASIVNRVETAFRLGGLFGQGKDEQQDALYDAARILTQGDRETRDAVLLLFKNWGLQKGR